MEPAPDGPHADLEGVTRVAITHPMRVWVEALESLLAPYVDIELVAAHPKPEWVQHAVTTRQADVVLIGLAPPASSFLPLLTEYFSAHPGLMVVGLSESPDPHLVAEAVRAGVRGWVEPTVSGDHLVRVLRGVVRGESWIPPTLLAGVIDDFLDERETRDRGEDLLAVLSARELEILRCLTQGMTRKEIAHRYFLSPHTVRTHMNNLLRKLDVHSTLAAVSIARQAGLADSPPE